MRLPPSWSQALTGLSSCVREVLRPALGPRVCSWLRRSRSRGALPRAACGSCRDPAVSALLLPARLLTLLTESPADAVKVVRDLVSRTTFQHPTLPSEAPPRLMADSPLPHLPFQVLVQNVPLGSEQREKPPPATPATGREPGASPTVSAHVASRVALASDPPASRLPISAAFPRPAGPRGPLAAGEPVACSRRPGAQEAAFPTHRCCSCTRS